MPKESELGTKTGLDDNDYGRVVTEEGESKISTMATMKTYMESGTSVPYIEVVDIGDDKGLICTEQWSVGKPSAPKESVFGSGDSYPIGTEDTTPDGTPKPGSIWHCTIANTTDLVITSATDITTDMASDSGSTQPMFNGTTAGNYVLIGSDYQFQGAKIKMSALGTVEPANITAEYLKDDSPTWVEEKYMVTDADFPYTQKGNVIASCSSCSEQWRFGFDPTNVPIIWNKVTLNINGTDYTKYWARFRITSTITSDPVVEQVKLHTNRYEINAEGSTEYFGSSRYSKNILIEKRTNLQRNPANENITISANMTEINIDNEFANSADDGIILRGILPEGLDSSIPVQVQVDWYPKGTNTGDVKLQLEVAKITEGSVMDGTNPTIASTPVITSIDNQEGEVQRTTFIVDVSGGLPGDLFYGDLHRDSSDAEDTYGANIVVQNWRVIGYFWRP